MNDLASLNNELREGDLQSSYVFTYILHTRLEYTEGRGIRNLSEVVRITFRIERLFAYHECSKVVLVLLSFRLEVDEIQTTIGERLDRNDLETGHDRRLKDVSIDGMDHFARLTAGFVPCALTGMRQILR